MKKIISLVLLASFFYGCTSAPLIDEKQVSVYASFYPLSFLTEQIAGEKANVVNVVPSGVEPHDFEPSSKTIAQITDSDLFLYNGVGIDEWAVQLVSTFDSDHTVINTSTFVDILATQYADDGEMLGVADPHFWLDPNNMMKIADKIKSKLISIDPANANFYENNYVALNAKLQTIDSNFLEGLKTCESKTFVTSHAAFAYLAKQYGLEMLAISGISPDEEPSSKKIAEISKLVEKYGIKYVFSESLLSSKITETIANDTDAQILVLNPIEGLTNDEEKTGEDYLTIMNSNLKNLKTALSCQ